MKEKTNSVSYIGKDQVKSVMTQGDDSLVTLKSGVVIKLKTILYDLIKSSVQQDGDINEIIQDRMARYIATQLGSFGINFFSVEMILSRIANYLSNKLDSAVAKKFGYKYKQELSVSDVLDNS